MCLNKQKIIVVTGGLGFIGSHLIEKLISRKYYPVIVDNFCNANINILSSLPKFKYSLIKCDINNKEKIEKCFKNFNPYAIVHLAAIHYIPYCIKNPEKTMEVNVAGTKSILELAIKLDVKKFIFSSSAAVYKPNKKPHKENDPTEPIDIYGRSKKQAERIIYNIGKKYNIDLTILRLSNVYGKNDLTPHFIPSLIKRIKKSNKIMVGNLNTYRDYINVADVVGVILRMIEEPVPKKYSIYNIGTGKNFSGEEIIKMLSDLTKKKIVTIKNKPFIRKIDRKYLTVNINKVYKDYQWKPVIVMKTGLKELIYD